MPMRWNVPDHAAVLARLVDALDGAKPGAVVLGPDGCGKSTLARLAAERRAVEHPKTRLRWVIGTPAERGVPFGAFSHLVRVADVGKPAALLLAARASLGDDLLLVVDDAHHLDVLSATLVYQLALAGTARLIVTADAAATEVPEAVRALWGDGLLVRLDITAAVPTSPDRVDKFLADLPAGARSALDYLAVQEPLPLTVLTSLTDDDAVTRAEELGVLEIRTRGGSGPDPVVYTAHPLFADRARLALGDGGTRRLRTEVVRRLSGESGGNVGDELRLAALAIDSDTPQPVEAVTAAAQQALRLGDLALCERLARSAVTRSAGLPARLVLAHALAWQGRGRDADAVLSDVDPAALSEPELMAWALPRAANQFFMLGEPERATAFLRGTRDRVSGTGPRTTLDALGATFAMNTGNLDAAVDLAEQVLADPAADDTAMAWAGSAAALCAARAGRFADVGPLVRRAQDAEHPGLLRFTLGLAELTVLLADGQLTAAQQLAQGFTDFAELQQPGRAIGEVLVARVLIAAGAFEEATALLEPAAAALERTGYSWGPLALMLLTTALARRGDVAATAKAFSRAESRHGTKSALFAPELGMARAWRLAGARDPHGAVTAARDAARMAERGGQWATALSAWHVAVRLGDARAVDPLTRLGAVADCAVGRLALAHARALADSDAAGLRAVADEFTAIGMAAAAEDALGQAQRCGG
ncbi:AAA family ATPase [Mycobacterium sp. M1]|uniref:AAA family ATPase n=1 Tax=Mycolicibacter acidiphilus TaxID=2835306 RepID=A0ABS5RLL2_9MYCO|nr:AAA family ATPase [Mycolicibacter acidiphilus]MBS9535177.1 AAA family ATPase [Mycolicibacter acidiphilus]